MTKMPQCLGLIMDGNRRFAKQTGTTTAAGHRAGVDKFQEVIGWCIDSKIKFVIAYAWSNENWQRPTLEVKSFLKLLRNFLTNQALEWAGQKVKIRFLGDLARFPNNIQKLLDHVEKQTNNNQTICVAMALSYGGRQEILAAVNKLLNNLSGGQLTEQQFSAQLYSTDFPEPDLIIRTGGEKRLSNFLPWQSVYSELAFSNTFWPQFSRKEFEQILTDFARRERRRGR